MNQKILVLIMILLPLFTIDAQEKQHQLSIGGKKHDQIRAMASDRFGNVYMVGSFQDETEFGASTKIALGDTDIFISKVNANGDMIWSKQLGSDFQSKRTISEYASDVVLVDDRFLYVTGVFRRSLLLQNEIVATANGKEDFFVMKLDLSGNLLWLNSFGSIHQDLAHSISADHLGNVYVAGSFQGDLTINQEEIQAHNDKDGFVMKLDDNCNAQWFFPFHSTGRSQIRDLHINGELCVALGEFKGKLLMEQHSLEQTAIQDMFITYLTTDGKQITSKGFGSSKAIYPKSLIVENGATYVSGSFTGGIGIGPKNYLSNGQKDAFVVKFDAGLNPVWFKQFGGQGIDKGMALISGDDDNLIFGGVGSRELKISDTFDQSIAMGDQDAFMVSLTKTEGTINWTNTISSDDQNQIHDLAKLPEGIMVVGSGKWEGDHNEGADAQAMKVSLDQQLAEIRVNLFPNPAEDKLTISFETDDNSLWRIEVSDLLGKSVIQKSDHLRSNQMVLDVSQLPGGLYVIKLDNGVQTSEHSFIVK